MRELTPVLIHFLYVLCRFGIDSLLLQCCRPLKPQSGISISRMHLSVCGVSLVPAYVVYTLWFMRFWIFFMWMAGTDLFLAGPYTIHAHVFKLTVYVTSFFIWIVEWLNEWMNEWTSGCKSMLSSLKLRSLESWHNSLPCKSQIMPKAAKSQLASRSKFQVSKTRLESSLRRRYTWTPPGRRPR